MPTARRSAPIPVLWLVAITVAAAALRLWHVGQAVLADDEIHLLTVIASSTLGEIPGKVIGYDFSIPLALLFRAWSEWTPLTEWMLRSPLLLVGCLTPALAVVVARRFVSTNVALLAGMLIAVHPFFIFYSRYVRPYAICVALLLLVLWLLDRWAETPRTRLLAAAAGLSALACWFQPLALILAGLLFGGLLVSECLGRAPARRVLAVVAGGVATVAFTLLLFAPSLPNHVDRTMQKVALGTLQARAVQTNAAVLAGMPGTEPTLLFFLLVVAGAAVLARREGRRAALLLVPACAYPVLVVLLRPAGLEDSQVLARYVFYALPLYVLFAATALGAALGAAAAHAARWLPESLAARASTDAAARTGSALLAALCLLIGPYRDIYAAPKAFAHHNVFQTYRYADDPHYRAASAHADDPPLHPFYKTLAADGDAVPLVVEWPPTLEYPANYYYLSQAYHGRQLKLLASPDDAWFVNDCLALRNVLDLAARDRWRLAPGTFVIMHRHPSVEQVRFLLDRQDWRPPGQRLREAFAETRSALAETLGEPVYEDSMLTVFRQA